MKENPPLRTLLKIVKKNPMLILSLVYFDEIFGPKIYLTAPDVKFNERIQFLPMLLNLDKEDYFFHQEGDYESLNVPFEIHNPEARGLRSTFMISLIFYKTPFQPKFYVEFLNAFISQFKSIEGAYKGIMRMQKSSGTFDEKVYTEIEQLFYYFYNSLPVETIMMERKPRLFMCGLRGAGKASIIKNLYEFVQRKPKKISQITVKRLLTKNFSVVSFHLPIEEKMEKIWDFYVENTDGIVFVIDASEPLMFSTAKEQLHVINDYLKDKSIPLQILISKIDKEGQTIEQIAEYMELHKLKFRNLQILGVSNRTHIGLVEGIRWMADQILERIFQL